MRILFLDYETNGRPGEPGFVPTEIGLVVYDLAVGRIVLAESYLVNSGQEMLPNIAELTGLSASVIKKYGVGRDYAAKVVWSQIEEATLVVVWMWRREWFEAYDAALWLAALVVIEMNILQGLGRSRPTD